MNLSCAFVIKEGRARIYLESVSTRRCYPGQDVVRALFNSEYFKEPKPTEELSVDGCHIGRFGIETRDPFRPYYEIRVFRETTIKKLNSIREHAQQHFSEQLEEFMRLVRAVKTITKEVLP